MGLEPNLRNSASQRAVILPSARASTPGTNSRKGTGFGFHLPSGLSERVIFREPFLLGLPLLDLREEETGVELNLSHIAARRELSEMLETIGLAAGTLAAAARQDESLRATC